MSSKKTLLVTVDYPPMKGGVANYYYNLVQELPEDSFFVLDNHNGALLSTARFLWPKWLKGLLNTWRVVKQRDINHILVGQVLPVGTIALVLKRFLGISYTVMTHAMDVTLLMNADAARRKKALLDRILRNASAVTTVSEYTATQLESLGVEREKIHIIPPCPHIDATRMSQDALAQAQAASARLDAEYLLEGKSVILTVARLHERKGVDMVLGALTHVLNEYPNAVYVIAGDGPELETLEQIVRVRNLEQSVIFLGAISDAEITQWYARADMFIMASRELENGDVEGFGIVFLEAGSFGKPVIGGNSGGVPDAIIDGKTGFLVDPNDTKMIAEGILALLTNSIVAGTLGDAAQKRVREQFQWPVQAERLQHIINSIQ